MKIILKYLVILILVLFPARSYGQFFAGAGANYMLPFEELDETNDASMGFNLNIESRKFCNLWYGIRIDYIDLQEEDEIDTFYVDAIYFSPTVKYNFTKSDCYTGNPQIFLQGMLTISSIGGKDRANRMGLGGAAGAGVGVPFALFKKCWSVDFSVLYSAPNFIARADERPVFDLVIMSLNLNIGL